MATGTIGISARRMTITLPSTVIASGDLTSLTSFAIPQGVWLVVVTGTYQANASGYRQIGLALSETEQNADRSTICRVRAADGAETSIIAPFIISHSAEERFYLNVRQNSGASLNLLAGVKIIQLK